MREDDQIVNFFRALLKLQRQKRYFLIKIWAISLLLFVGIFLGANSHSIVSANQSRLVYNGKTYSCTEGWTTANADAAIPSWTNGRYFYQMWVYALGGIETSVGPYNNDLKGLEITSQGCNAGVYNCPATGLVGKGANTAAGDEVCPVYGDMTEQAAAADVQPGAFPIGMFLGAENQGGANNSGMVMRDQVVGKAPADSPPVFNYNYKSAVASIQDGGAFDIGSSPTGTHNGIAGAGDNLIWCKQFVDLGWNQSPNCGPSPLSQPDGAGWMQDPFNCHLSLDPGVYDPVLKAQCDAASYTWLEPPYQLTNNLTPTIGVNPTTGVLGNFTAHTGDIVGNYAPQPSEPGFGLRNYVEVKYPIVDFAFTPTCTQLSYDVSDPIFATYPGSEETPVSFDIYSSSDETERGFLGTPRDGSAVLTLPSGYGGNVTVTGTMMIDGVSFRITHSIVCDNPGQGVVVGAQCYTPGVAPANASYKSVWGYAYDDDRLASSLQVYAYTSAAHTVLAGGPVTANSALPATPNPPGGSHGYTIDLSSYNGLTPHTFYLFAEDINSAGAAIGILDPVGTVTVGRSATLGCAQPECGGVSVSDVDELDGVPEPGGTATVKLAWQWADYGSNGVPATGTTPIVETITPASYTVTGSPIIAPIPPDTGNNRTETTTYQVIFNQAGPYTIVESLAGTTPSNPGPSCQTTVIVKNKPYLKVYGGDTMSGSGFATAATACLVNPKAGSYAWDVPDVGSIPVTYNGSSTSNGAFAVKLVDGYASGNTVQASGAGVGAPQSLTFANDGSLPVTTPSFGGNFGSSNCVQDYYTKPWNTNYLSTSPPLSIGAFPTTGSPSDAAGVDRTVDLYQSTDAVPVNVAITNSFDYPAWTSTADMPLLYVVVKGGNIYIDSNVTKIAGVYIAEPNALGVGGNIYTCATGTAPYPASGMFSATVGSGCNSQLTVDGAFIANNIHFLRTYGTTASATPTTGASNCSTVNTAAEVFCYTPLEWLVNPYTPVGSDVDSMTGLPPTL